MRKSRGSAYFTQKFNLSKKFAYILGILTIVLNKSQDKLLPSLVFRAKSKVIYS